jgi:hypothetical protein
MAIGGKEKQQPGAVSQDGFDNGSNKVHESLQYKNKRPGMDVMGEVVIILFLRRYYPDQVLGFDLRCNTTPKELSTL